MITGGVEFVLLPSERPRSIWTRGLGLGESRPQGRCAARGADAPSGVRSWERSRTQTGT